MFAIWGVLGFHTLHQAQVAVLSRPMRLRTVATCNELAQRLRAREWRVCDGCPVPVPLVAAADECDLLEALSRVLVHPLRSFMASNDKYHALILFSTRFAHALRTGFSSCTTSPPPALLAASDPLQHSCFSAFSTTPPPSLCLFHHKESGSQVHLCPRPCSSTCRWAKLQTHRRRRPHSVCILLPSWVLLPPRVCHRQETGFCRFFTFRNSCSRYVQHCLFDAPLGARRCLDIYKQTSMLLP